MAMFNYVDYAQNPRLMRCGSSTFGYRHIRDSRHDGFDDALDLDITNAFKNDHTPEPQGTSLKYNNFGFIVIYETKKQSDGAPKGIITAYLLAKR